MALDHHPPKEYQAPLSPVEGYILIPHELLHIVGYRLVGIRCKYQWGGRSVKPIGSMTQKMRLVGMLFPFAIFGVGFLICAVASGLAFLQILCGGPIGWFILWTGLALVFGVYTGTATTDLRQAYLLVHNKPWYGWTPFDIFFWPFVDWDAIRKKEAAGQAHEQ